MIEKHRRESNFPVSAADWLESIRLSTLPVIKLTDKIYLGSIRSPLTEHPIASGIMMKAIVHVIVYSLAERTVNRQPVLHFKNHLVSAINDFLIWFEPFIVIVDHFLLFLCAHNLYMVVF